MATIRMRGNRYHVQIRKKGFSPITKSFPDKKSAYTFIKETEAKMEKGLFQDASLAEKTTLSNLIALYTKSILPQLKGKEIEAFRLNMLSQELGHYHLTQIQPATISQLRDKRLRTVMPATVKRELNLLSRVLTASEREFGIYLPHGNPVSKIRLPKEPEGRKRRLNTGELEQIKEQLKDNTLMLHAVILAIETAMRRSELCRIRYRDIDTCNYTLFIAETKNGLTRTIPLSPKARESLKVLTELHGQPNPNMQLLPVKPHSITRAFERACQRANIADLRFHDLRHEATSRFFEKGLNVMEAASITGHQDLRMLRRYTHIKAETLVDRL